jgi:hypothetical protein
MQLRFSKRQFPVICYSFMRKFILFRYYLENRGIKSSKYFRYVRSHEMVYYHDRFELPYAVRLNIALGFCYCL